MRSTILFFVVLTTVPWPLALAQGDVLSPVPFTSVQLRGFWGERQEVNRNVTVPYVLDKCEETGRCANFAKAAGLIKGEFQGRRYDDSDVYKAIEGACYTLGFKRDGALRKRVDDLIAKIARAQRPDGYLNTFFTLKKPDKRWTDLESAHELYCAGHLFEAAVAHHAVTGRKTFLQVAVKLADHIDSVFGPGKRRDVPGHPEIELALVKLHRATHERRYLQLAKFFLDQRGLKNRGRLYGTYCQDHAPLLQQTEAVGHAVRAGYLYTAMADIARLNGDRAYAEASRRLWQDVVSSKLYLTGGVGSSRRGEAFGAAWSLPNLTAYNETCAAIANALWCHRMFLLDGDARYLDVLERVLYNGFLAGVSLRGDRFMYPNPLACDGATKFNQGSITRQPWFSCSCCPVNVVRFVPQIGGFGYATRGDEIFINLYAAGAAKVQLPSGPVRLKQETDYPWDGRVRIEISPKEAGTFTVHLRIPGWASNRPVPGDLYVYEAPSEEALVLKVNGWKVKKAPEKGFISMRRRWKSRDLITLELPMPVRRVRAGPKVTADRHRVALERGPIVYCVEQSDSGSGLEDLVLPDDAELEAVRRADLLGGVTVIKSSALRTAQAPDSGEITTKKATLTAIPYYAWSNREPGEMSVWLPRNLILAEARPLPTVASRSTASASHVWRGDTVGALNDLIDPASSSDGQVPRFTWWDHQGSEEWVQYDFERVTRVSRVSVYWFDDGASGACRLPVSWKVLHHDGERWVPAGKPSGYGVLRDAFNEASFAPVNTKALRLQVQLAKGFSGGILEWRVR